MKEDLVNKCNFAKTVKWECLPVMVPQEKDTSSTFLILKTMAKPADINEFQRV